MVKFPYDFNLHLLIINEAEHFKICFKPLDFFFCDVLVQVFFFFFYRVTFLNAL